MLRWASRVIFVFLCFFIGLCHQKCIFHAFWAVPFLGPLGYNLWFLSLTHRSPPPGLLFSSSGDGIFVDDLRSAHSVLVPSGFSHHCVLWGFPQDSAGHTCFGDYLNVTGGFVGFLVLFKTVLVFFFSQPLPSVLLVSLYGFQKGRGNVQNRIK